MKIRNLLFFAGALVISLTAASWRFYDSAHTIGLIRAGGGEARHPVVLDQGLDRYTLIATATVIPPYRGDIRVALEGMPEMEYVLYDSTPLVDLSPYRHPRLQNQILYGVEPRDRIALWVVLRRRVQGPSSDLVMAAAEESVRQGSCCAAASPEAEKYSAKGANEVAGTGEAASAQLLAFYDLKSGQRLLGVPITFREAGRRGNDASH